MVSINKNSGSKNYNNSRPFKPNFRSTATSQEISRRLDAAMGRVPCDVLLKNVNALDVFTMQWRRKSIGIHAGVIVLVEDADVSIQAQVRVDGSKYHLVPGFIDAHVHLESSLMVPRHFQNSVLPLGTTTAVCDPHELANVCGVSGIEFFLKSADLMDLDLCIMLSSCVPATHFETNGGGVLSAQDLIPLRKYHWALGLAEMMNMPGVLAGEPAIIDKISGLSGTPLDGHCPLLRGRGLSAYAAAGISSCHETSQQDEAIEKLTKGLSVWVREGSVAKDLKELIPLLNLKTVHAMGFCTDDRNPLDIAEQGHIDYLIREGLEQTQRSELSCEVIYRAASYSVANHYGLNRGHYRVGAIAPGYMADLVLLNDPETCAIARVMKRGQWIDERSNHESVAELLNLEGNGFTNTVRANTPELSDLEAPHGRVHIIGVVEGKIITTHDVGDSQSTGVSELTVLERYGKGLKPVNAFARGFGDSFKGAIASSVGHDSHNLIVVGNSSANRRAGLACLIEMGGGFCVVNASGEVAAKLPLPLGGLMSQKTPKELVVALKLLKQASQSVGCVLTEPFLQLAFLSLPVIPSLKITDQGLVDVDLFQFINVRV